MIIFDLDGTLALCDHRRHFVDPRKSGYTQLYNTPQCFFSKKWVKFFDGEALPREFIPDYKAFYEACDLDEPNKPIIEILRMLSRDDKEIQVWSGRCESVREKSECWLNEYVGLEHLSNVEILKMRPIGDNTPDEELKLRWLNEEREKDITIEMVFDDRKKVVDMWRSQGITCLQVAAGDF